MNSALRIGITIGLNRPDESLWVNGIKQNALYLAKLFKHSPCRHKVNLVNTTPVPVTDQLPWSMAEFPTLAIDDALDDLDVLIELGGQIGPAQTARLKANGGRLVSYCCGSEYVQNMQAIIFNRHLGDSPFINQLYDALWVVPQNTDSSLHFFQTLRRTPAIEVPFVWDPMCLEARMAGLSGGGRFRHRQGPARLSVLEQNIDVLKFCLYPVLIAEEVIRQAPEEIEFLHVANAERFVCDDKEFAGIMRQLDIVAANKASFIGRVDIPDFLSLHTDVVISHQWGLPLNYMYLEAAWQGFPLVHNADLVSDLGFFYPGNNVQAGADCLLAALSLDAEAAQTYIERQRIIIRQRFLATNSELIDTYDRLLGMVMAGAIKA